MIETSTIAVTKKEAVILEQVLSSSMHGTKLIHFHVNDTLHVASFKSIPSDFLRECWQLDRLVKYHKFFLRLELALAVHNLMISLILPDEAVVPIPTEVSSGNYRCLLYALSGCSKDFWCH